MAVAAGQASARFGIRRWLGAAAVLLVLGAAASWQLRMERARRGAFPRVEGRIQVAGLERPVEIVRDERGVPHIFASTAADAWLGLGLAHAQDRLAQMVFLRSSARGELAAVRGASELAADRMARTLGFARDAEADLQSLPVRTRRVLSAYASGVNAHLSRLTQGHESLPLGLGAEPEPWQPADSLALFRQHAWAMGATHEESLVLSELLTRFGGLDARLFFPRTLGLEAIGERPDEIVRRSAPEAGRSTALLRERLGLAGASVGSSAVVVHPSFGRFGGLLAGDAHHVATAPALLHQAHVQGPRLDVAGVAIPGIPAFWSGFNGRVAWAATHLPAVVTDLLEETLGEDADASLRSRDELYQVAGAAPESHPVRESRRGPILSDLLGASKVPLSVRWPGQRDRSGPTGLLDLAGAADLEAARAALAGHTIPVLDVALLDAAGEGGTQVAGDLPDRRLPSGGVPVPARGRAYQWAGRIDPERLPWRGVTAKQPLAVAADGLPQGWRRARIELFWRDGSRSARIAARIEALASEGGVRLQDLPPIQADVRVPRARTLVTESLALIDVASLPAEGRAAAQLLESWHGSMAEESGGAAAFHLFFEQLLRRLFEPRLGQDLLGRYRRLRGVSELSLVLRVVRAAADGGELPGGWADPAAVRSAIQESLRDAWIRGGVRLGSNREKWRWGALHGLRFRPLHPEAWGRRSDALGPYPYGGDGETVQMASFQHGNDHEGTARGERFGAVVASVFRMAVEQGQLGQGLTSLAPGQVEHPGHPNAADQVGPWLEGRPRLLSASRAVVEDQPVRRLILEPAS